MYAQSAYNGLDSLIFMIIICFKTIASKMHAIVICLELNYSVFSNLKKGFEY